MSATTTRIFLTPSTPAQKRIASFRESLENTCGNEPGAQLTFYKRFVEFLATNSQQLDWDLGLKAAERKVRLGGKDGGVA